MSPNGVIAREVNPAPAAVNWHYWPRLTPQTGGITLPLSVSP
jgi:hypothetical protein